MEAALGFLPVLLAEEGVATWSPLGLLGFLRHPTDELEQRRVHGLVVVAHVGVVAIRGEEVGLGYDPTDDWAQVDMGGKKGWVATRLLSSSIE